MAVSGSRERLCFPFEVSLINFRKIDFVHILPTCTFQSNGSLKKNSYFSRFAVQSDILYGLQIRVGPEESVGGVIDGNAVRPLHVL